MRPFACTVASALLTVNAVCGQGSTAGYYEPELTPQDRAHWSFKPPVRRPPPHGAGGTSSRNPIDAFILARLQSADLVMAPEAERLALLRRVTFDLTGLPPTTAEIGAFLADRTAESYARVVDRLLASPHYGEHWAQHWLDVVRFAETNGYEADSPRPHAWRYRDYVIRSLNDDKPYSRFLTEQVSGDELAAGRDPKACADLFVATGLHRCGPTHIVGGNLGKDAVRQELVTEMVNGLSSAVLGMTIACARCHDHKFDPVSQADYYRLQAFFAAAEYADVDIAADDERHDRQEAGGRGHCPAGPVEESDRRTRRPRPRAGLEAEAGLARSSARAAVETPAAKRTAEQKRLAADAARALKASWDEILAAMEPADRDRRADLRSRLHEWEARLPRRPPRAGRSATPPPCPSRMSSSAAR